MLSLTSTVTGVVHSASKRHLAEAGQLSAATEEDGSQHVLQRVDSEAF